MQEHFLQILAIYVAGITGLYKGIPLGLALGSHPVVIAGFTALGSITSVLIIYFAGESLKKRLFKRMGESRMERNKKRMAHLMDRYGTVGLGLIVSGTLGPIPAALVGMAVVRDTRRLLVYLIIGIVIWSAGLTAIGVFGLDLIGEVF